MVHALRGGRSLLLVCTSLLLPLVCDAWTPQGVDPYEVLGLSRGDAFDAAALKRAYRQAALRWHPDKVPEDERPSAEQKFIEVAWAYEVLGDPARRPAYDHAPFPSQPPPSPSSPSPQPSAEGFSMDEATRVFRETFGAKSDTYRDLLRHLASSATASGDKALWQRHAHEISEELAGGDTDFSVETQLGDGSERAKTSRKTVGSTQTTVTEHTRTETSSSARLAGSSAHPTLPQDAHSAHAAAHEAHLKAHAAAVRAAQLATSGGAQSRLDL